jgi:hypothetical protein
MLNKHFRKLQICYKMSVREPRPTQGYRADDDDDDDDKMLVTQRKSRAI